jgi:hypothetical protein
VRAGVRVVATRAGWLLAISATLAVTGCTDVGDSSAVPGSGAATAPDDGAASTIEASAEDATESAQDSSLSVDATLTSEDAGATASSAGGEDAGSTFDATIPLDANLPDSGVPEAALQDAAHSDATTTQDAAPDGKPTDAAPEASPVDAAHDATVADAATPDATSDTGPSPLAPCTSSGQTGCVQCQYNNGAGSSLPNADQVCTPTEAALVEHDIASALATAPGPDPNGSCYQCAALSGCLDDSQFADTGHECEDLTGAGDPAACQATLACILASSCGATALSTCYCGTAPVSGSCAAVGSSNAANGACVNAEAAGLGFAANDGLDILKNFTSTTLPAGVANNIFQCATSNGCTACLQ